MVNHISENVKYLMNKEYNEHKVGYRDKPFKWDIQIAIFRT